MITDVATPAPTTPARHRTRPEPQVRQPLIDYAMALDVSSIPDGLEIVHTGGTHHELVVKNGVNLTPEEFQSKLGSMRTLPGC